MKIWQGILFLMLLVFVHSKKRNSDRIIGGEAVTDPSKFPFYALLFTANPNDTDLDYAKPCGGTLIHKQWILTAGRCFPENETELDSILKLDKPMVFMGTVGSIRPDKVKWNSKNATIIEIRRHPDYKTDPLINWYDIALVKLKKPYEMSKTIQTIELATMFGLCRYCILIGTGKTNDTQTNFYSGTTKFAKALIKEFEDLSMLPSKNLSKIRDCVDNTTFFTESKIGDVSSGFAEHRDIGGPAICEIDGGKTQILIGVIIGRWEGQPNKTAINAIERVDLYIDFIKEYVPEVRLGRIKTASDASYKKINMFPLFLAIAFCICTV